MLTCACVQDGRFEVQIPKPSFQLLREKTDVGGVRSPKYPSTVTKVSTEASLYHRNCSLTNMGSLVDRWYESPWQGEPSMAASSCCEYVNS